MVSADALAELLNGVPQRIWYRVVSGDDVQMETSQPSEAFDEFERLTAAGHEAVRVQQRRFYRVVGDWLDMHPSKGSR